MLILFDIDMTMITTSGVGMKAMQDTGRELLGDRFTSTDGIQFAGRLDPLIISEIFTSHGVEDAPHRHREFRDIYRRHLQRRLAEPGNRRALPGVPDLLASLSKKPNVVLGVLTGNFEETGSMKLRACGIDPAIFKVSVWGDESPHHPPKREHLVPVGLERARAHNPALRPADATVIGDTPHDIQCARAHGCRSLGVATGHFTITQLEESGADLAVKDLSDTGAVLTWLLNGSNRQGPGEAR